MNPNHLNQASIVDMKANSKLVHTFYGHILEELILFNL